MSVLEDCDCRTRAIDYEKDERKRSNRAQKGAEWAQAPTAAEKRHGRSRESEGSPAKNREVDARGKWNSVVPAEKDA